MRKIDDYPQNQGLYNFKNEHDSCGVGFVANVNGNKTHKIINQGIQVLIRLLHRGAVGSDKNTGDGAGILIQIPHDFFVTEVIKSGFSLPRLGEYAVGMVFFPSDNILKEKAASILTKSLDSEGFELIGWRDVPTDSKTLGVLAKSTQPDIKQFFIKLKDANTTEKELERKCYLLRKVIEKEADKITSLKDNFYIPSLSSQTIVYKGLLMGTQLPDFYPDLKNENFKSAMALVHQRYSTNTFPTWSLAQPFRFLGHNGEINTLRGNLNQMKAREQTLRSDAFGKDISKLLPILKENQSDSASLDSAVELLTLAGRSLPHSMMMLIPQAWGNQFHLGPDLKGFFDYHSGLMEPWDGPASVAFSDGKSIGAMLDRNGLRPARYTITKDNFIVLASEAGVLDVPSEKIINKGHLSPGHMIFVDLESQRIQFNSEIKNKIARRLPYRRWVNENRIAIHGFFDSVQPPLINDKELFFNHKLFGYTREEIRKVIKPMADSGHEASGSMGNDAALAIISEKPQILYNYFKQLFAQVTNPAIDPIREELVMGLMTFIGSRDNILEEAPHHAHLLKLQHPILTNEDVERIKNPDLSNFHSFTLNIGFVYQKDKVGHGLKEALEELTQKTEKAVNQGFSLLILTDKYLNENETPIPALLAISSVNQHLTHIGLRTCVDIIIESGEPREVMHFALLLGYGATAINPYIALETVVDLVYKEYVDHTSTKAMENYIRAVCKGILKVMSKMGISTLRSYRGAQVFEAVGLNSNLIEKYFSGTTSRIEGIGLKEIAEESFIRHKSQSNADLKYKLLDTGGDYHYREKGENHLWTPETIVNFHRAVRNNDKEYYKKYANYINTQENHLCTLRGLFDLPPKNPISINEVESAENILKRFSTGAMSFGSISKEAHETIAIAMNRLGGMSNSGEGGESPERFNTRDKNHNLCSAIKQVASGRFGVTTEYLANSKEIQIKIAQGAKPGEGGQLPGHKVDKTIAKVRHSTPGVSLISPPPHHDIYSIEDLAQLIFDLKNANPEARISVKLVSEIGVGTVAAGVSKGHADMVLISGHDGGTGASPLTSIKHTGLPWELGLAETQQTLVLNKLRDRIRIQCDGQMKTGRDVIIAALLGAEEFGFATTILVALGCVLMRKCHSNTCPVGIATQDSELRKRYSGKPEYIENFLYFVAEEVREYLAMFGFRTLDEIVGRSDLIDVNRAINFWKTKNLDFSKILDNSNTKGLTLRCTKEQEHGIDEAFDLNLINDCQEAINNKTPLELQYNIDNSQRTIGTMLSSKIVKKYGANGLPPETLNVTFRGSAGQSFGAFLASGITFTLIGEANDYVGKGLSGGKIILRPSEKISFTPSQHTIAGNVILYGATNGEMYIRGKVGERFAIRNSGVRTVVEAVGDHCCEYMTGGRVVILGKTGGNFAAGMSGGIAYVYDEDSYFDQRCNLSMVDLEPIANKNDVKTLKNLIEKHYFYTNSQKAKSILNDWKNQLPKFVKVFPMEYKKVLGEMLKEDEEIEREREQIND